MRTSTPRWSIGLGAAFGLLLGALTVQAAEGKGDACKEACECHSTCEKKLQTCNERCSGLVDAARTKCVVECNDDLLSCVSGCPNGNCACGY